MTTTLDRNRFHALFALALGLLAACGSGAGEANSTTTTIETPTTVAETTPSTVGPTTTTSTLATTTTELVTATTEADVVEIVVEGGEVVSGPDRVEAELGSTVTLIVVSDAADHVHVHGYDLFFDLAAGSPEEIQFNADVPGIFEIELEDSHLLLLELEVR